MGYEEERDRSGHRRSRRAKPSEMEDDGLTLITDSFTERREDGSHRSGDRSRSGQKAAKRGQTQPGSSRESRNQEKTRTMNRSDIYADPVKLKARRKKKRKIWFILLEIAVLIGILCFAGYSYISSRLDLMQRLPWNPDEIKNVEISEEKQEQMSGYWTAFSPFFPCCFTPQSEEFSPIPSMPADRPPDTRSSPPAPPLSHTSVRKSPAMTNPRRARSGTASGS